MPAATVVTLNLLNDLLAPTRWEARRHLIVEGLRALAPEVIGLQEVRLPDRHAHWLADQLGGYTVWVCPKTGELATHEGLAILSRLPVSDHATLDLGAQNRVAHRITLAAERPWTFVNGHFFWWTGPHPKRLAQVERLLGWLAAETPPGQPVVAVGDFNGEPHTDALQRMGQRFRSAHAARHGHEPPFTAPTPLQRPQITFKKLLVRGLRLLNKQKHRHWRGTLDYIFVSPEVTVADCRVVLDQPAPADPTLYPSDHFGLAAWLDLP